MIIKVSVKTHRALFQPITSTNVQGIIPTVVSSRFAILHALHIII